MTMPNIRGTSNDIKIYNDENSQSKQVKNLELEEIEFLFATDKTEDKRKDLNLLMFHLKQLVVDKKILMLKNFLMV